MTNSCLSYVVSLVVMFDIIAGFLAAIFSKKIIYFYHFEHQVYYNIALGCIFIGLGFFLLVGAITESSVIVLIYFALTSTLMTVLFIFFTHQVLLNETDAKDIVILSIFFTVFCCVQFLIFCYYRKLAGKLKHEIDRSGEEDKQNILVIESDDEDV